MKILKIFCYICALMMILTVSEAKTLTEKYPSLYNNEWEKKVKLTSAQEEQLKIIRDKNQEKMNVFLMEIETIHHEMAALVDENTNQMRDILDEKQKVKFDMYQYQLKKQRNEHKGEEKPSRKKMRVY